MATHEHIYPTWQAKRVRDASKELCPTRKDLQYMGNMGLGSNINVTPLEGPRTITRSQPPRNIVYHSKRLL